ncbi:hypothetical protein J4402_05430 [Candidatus Pacearchaeota archaeon]|nr:hypothetical protein [Candidatus Pacearchaeota archaeon]
MIKPTTNCFQRREWMNAVNAGDYGTAGIWNDRWYELIFSKYQQAVQKRRKLLSGKLNRFRIIAHLKTRAEVRRYAEELEMISDSGTTLKMIMEFGNRTENLGRIEQDD